MPLDIATTPLRYSNGNNGWSTALGAKAQTLRFLRANRHRWLSEGQMRDALGREPYLAPLLGHGLLDREDRRTEAGSFTVYRLNKSVTFELPPLVCPLSGKTRDDLGGALEVDNLDRLVAELSGVAIEEGQ
jgi:hypothetical protein